MCFGRVLDELEISKVARVLEIWGKAGNKVTRVSGDLWISCKPRWLHVFREIPG